MTNEKQNEDMLNVIEGKKICCGKPMNLLGMGAGSPLMDNIDEEQMFICLDCGSYISLTKGQMDIEDVLNNVNSYGSQTDANKFVALHPEFSDEVIASR